MSTKHIEVELIRAGQPRRYADAEYEAYISGRAEGTLTDGAVFYYELNEADVRILTRMFVREFPEEPTSAFCAYLAVCTPVGATDAMRAIADPKWQPGERTRWRVKVVQPYTD